MAASPGATNVMYPLLHNQNSDRESIMMQRVNGKNIRNAVEKNTSVKNVTTKMTTEVSGLRILNDIESTTLTSEITGKKGTSKGGSVATVPKLTSIQDMYPKTSAGTGMFFTQAKPAQAQETALNTFVKQPVPVAVKSYPPLVSAFIPDLDNVKGVISTQPTMKTSTPPLQRADIGTSFSPMQNWKTVVPIVLVFLVAMIFGRKVS